MLSLFPYLLDYSVIAITVLRITTALFFLWEGYVAFKKPKRWYDYLAMTVSICGSVLLFIGIFTQADALALTIVAGFHLWRENQNKKWRAWDLKYYLLLAILSLSFLCLGPGVYAIDYPL